MRALARACASGTCLTRTHLVDVTADSVPEAFLTVEGANATEGSLGYTLRYGQPTLLFAHAGNQAWVEPRDGNVVLVHRMYAQDDARCCPSGKDRVSTYRWDTTRLVLVSRTGGSPGTAPYEPQDQVVT